MNPGNSVADASDESEVDCMLEAGLETQSSVSSTGIITIINAVVFFITDLISLFYSVLFIVPFYSQDM